MNKKLSHKTAKSRIVYEFGDDFVRTHSDTLKCHFDTPINSTHGRYLLSLLARKSSRKSEISYETPKNVFSYRFGEDSLMRFDKQSDRRIRSYLSSVYGRQLLSYTLKNGEF